MRKLLKLAFFLFIAFLIFTFGFYVSNKLSETPSQLSHPLNADVLFSLINDWRSQTNLQPFIKDERVCDFAKMRLYDQQLKFGHDGFKELHDRLYPNSHMSENIMTSATTEQAALTSWLHSASHAAALKYPYKYSCVTAYGDKAVQIFADF